MKLIVSLFIVLATSVAHAEYYPAPEYRVFGTAHSNEDEHAVDELLARFREAWADRDAAGVAALHADDMEWVNAFGRTLRGAAALEAFLAEGLFPAFDAEVWRRSMESFQPLSRRYLGTDTVVINALTHSGPGSALDVGERRVSFNLVLAKQDGDWKIVHQIIADIRPRRSSGE